MQIRDIRAENKKLAFELKINLSKFFVEFNSSRSFTNAKLMKLVQKGTESRIKDIPEYMRTTNLNFKID